MKKSKFILLTAGLMLATGAFAQQVPTAELDVIIRDFPATAPGFQEEDCGLTTNMLALQLRYDIAGCPEDIIDFGGYEDYIRYRYCAYPVKVSGACNSANIEAWFDNYKEFAPASRAKSIRDVMVLEDDDHDGLYKISYTDADGGYFPLDKYSTNPDYAGKVFGFEGEDHNYGFSIAGSATFKYVGTPDVFSFIGNDDMWIFVDGKLEVDLGGVHGAMDGGVDMTTLADKHGWEIGSTHVINFFYMNRQTTSSNFELEMNLRDLAPARFGSPRILEAITIIFEDEIATTTIYTNSELDINSVKQHIGEFPIIVRGSKSKDILGYKLESIEYAGMSGSQGYGYIIKGTVCNDLVCTEKRNLINNDSLSFNVISDDMEDFMDPGFALANNNQYIKSKNGMPATQLKWGRNETSLPPIPIGQMELVESNPFKTDFAMDEWFKSGSIGSFSGGSVSGFGSQGEVIPANRAGELLLTVFPNAGSDEYGYFNYNYNQGNIIFGLPPKQDGANPWGIADPTDTESTNGGYMFVKNGFANESSVGAVKAAPTRCTRKSDDPDDPQINCLSFQTLIRQPFQVSVSVYDEDCELVSQYNEEVAEDEFRRVVQAPGFYDDYGTSVNPTVNGSDRCYQPDPNKPSTEVGGFGNLNTLTTNGVVKSGINIYPFSNKGEPFESGVYTALIEWKEVAYIGCMSIGGSANYSYFNGWESHGECGYIEELQTYGCLDTHHFYVEEIEWNKVSTKPNTCKEKLMNDKKPTGDKDGESPILSQVNSNSLGIGTQTYYNLQGTSLGATKPTTPGIYIEKIGNSAKRILVK